MKQRLILAMVLGWSLLRPVFARAEHDLPVGRLSQDVLYAVEESEATKWGFAVVSESLADGSKTRKFPPQLFVLPEGVYREGNWAWHKPRWRIDREQFWFIHGGAWPEHGSPTRPAGIHAPWSVFRFRQGDLQNDPGAEWSDDLPAWQALGDELRDVEFGSPAEVSAYLGDAYGTAPPRILDSHSDIYFRRLQSLMHNGLFSDSTPPTERRASRYGKHFAYDLVSTGRNSFEWWFACKMPNDRTREAVRKTIPKLPDQEEFLCVIEHRLLPVRDVRKNRYYWRGEWAVTDVFSPAYVAPFHGVRSGDRRFLVTNVGDILALHEGSSSTQNKLETVRLPAGELVQALIYDVDRDHAAFAFTPNYWFEVKLPLEYHEFELDPAKPDDPLPTLLRAAREVRKLYPAVPKADKRR